MSDSSQIKHTPKQIFELMLTQQLWTFDDEDFERMWLVFINTFSEMLQQKINNLPGGLSSDYEIMACSIYKGLSEELK